MNRLNESAITECVKRLIGEGECSIWQGDTVAAECILQKHIL